MEKSSFIVILEETNAALVGSIHQYSNRSTNVVNPKLAVCKKASRYSSFEVQDVIS